MDGDSDKILGEFMQKQNMGALGEKVETIEDNSDNFLPDSEKSKNNFNDGEKLNKDDTAYEVAKKTLGVALTIPILIGGLVSLFYLLIKFMPYLLFLIKKLIILFVV
jgi:hypothetical protein